MTEQPDPVSTEIGADPAVDVSGNANDDEIYHGYSVDDENQPQSSGDSLVDDRGLAEPLDEGYSPPEKWSAGQRWGNTPLEEALGETIDQRLEQEIPEPDPYEQAEAEAESGALDDDIADPMEAPELAAVVDDEVGSERAGRLVEPDEGVRTDTEADLAAEDVGIDGAGSSAEEAAVHIIEE